MGVPQGLLYYRNRYPGVVEDDQKAFLTVPFQLRENEDVVGMPKLTSFLGNTKWGFFEDTKIVMDVENDLMYTVFYERNSEQSTFKLRVFSFGEEDELNSEGSFDVDVCSPIGGGTHVKDILNVFYRKGDNSLLIVFSDDFSEPWIYFGKVDLASKVCTRASPNFYGIQHTMSAYDEDNNAYTEYSDLG